MPKIIIKKVKMFLFISLGFPWSQPHQNLSGVTCQSLWKKSSWNQSFWHFSVSFLVSFTISYTPVLKKILTMQLYSASVALHRSLPWEFGQFAWESVLHPQKVDVELSIVLILLLDCKMPCLYRKYRYLRRRSK